MDRGRHDQPVPDLLCNGYGTTLGRRDHLALVLLEPPVALDRVGVVITEESIEEYRFDGFEPAGRVLVVVDETEREPVVGIGTVDRRSEDQQGPALFQETPEALTGGPEGDQGPRVGRVRKTGGDHQDRERPPEEWRCAELGRDELAGNPAVLDEPDEGGRTVPEECGTGSCQPLITPIGRNRATSRPNPTSWTTLTTSVLSL